jgi:hypothetical protein
VSVVPVDVLADGAEGSHEHQFAGRVDEHGGAVEGAQRIRTRRRRQPVSDTLLITINESAPAN